MAKHKGTEGTKLNRIHPYPAMIADEFALHVANRYVKQGSLVLDPFCGTGRTLYAAASVGGVCFGVDVNPLAVLIALAKNVKALPMMPWPVVERYSQNLSLELQPGRKVKWFSHSVEQELSLVIGWINSLKVSSDVRIALACILSATVREVSYCRKRQWKLHRMSATTRSTFRPSALKVFKRRLEAAARDLSNPSCAKRVAVARGDARQLGEIVKRQAFPETYDVIFTSPPYGDSRSTVGYGGMSSMCLGVLRHIRDLRLNFESGQEIDSQCLGGRGRTNLPRLATHKYWRGKTESHEFMRVNQFLDDLATACKEIAAVSHPGTRAIFVVSRRSVRRRRLYIDVFLTDELKKYGFRLIDKSQRCIEGKNTPYIIDRKARCIRAERVRTMEHELILVFERVAR